MAIRSIQTYIEGRYGENFGAHDHQVRRGEYEKFPGILCMLEVPYDQRGMEQELCLPVLPRGP